jgi:hypothetical protein
LRQVAEESGVQVHHIRNQEIREDEELI